MKISVSVLCYPCVYIGLGDAALATIRVLKMDCYCNQNPVLQIAQNGGLGAGLQASAQRAGRSFLHPAAAALWLWAAGCGAAANNCEGALRGGHPGDAIPGGGPAMGREVAAAPTVLWVSVSLSVSVGVRGTA